MNLIHIGEKVINLEKIYNKIDKILEARSSGLSQQEVADKLNVDRTFISRLEGIGEVHKGKDIAVAGFPIKNKDEVISVLEKHGIDFYIIMTEQERREFAESKNGAELINELMALLAKGRSYDVVIVIASDMRSKMLAALLDKEIITINIGHSPLTQDVYIDPALLDSVIESIKDKKA
ncbi:helix-turn-helix domain-containing protein [Mahella australiensis]|uniref:Helix-turn-helix domain protein n=1 Tax=Mahella australiensis (strain DSM 15567 / CIP 107919 / 50-1 BON) TaxID=697281 RepID=F3ZZL4_MAHA5|nr:helix-turn-helix transcriptional regulator [Mahella australiensis]AEE96840.1 helix-turn-helix domain protein [Mahella australiensis 50-1 BON]